MKLNNKLIQRMTFVCVAIIVLVSCLLFPVSATSVELYEVNIETFYKSSFTNNLWTPTGSFVITPNNDTPDIYSTQTDVSLDHGIWLMTSYEFYELLHGVLAEKGKTTRFTFDNLYYYSYFPTLFTPFRRVTSILCTLVYTDGSFETFAEGIKYFINGNILSVDFEVVPSKAVESVKVQVEGYWEINHPYKVPVQQFLGEHNGDNQYQFALDVRSEEAGLLEGIGNQIGTAINGTPQQNQQVQDSVGGLNNSTDKLGQIGDQMASVEKPTIDSNKVSADSLVPNTALVTLSSPFLALWENNQLLAMLTIVVSLVLVSWVFFGKKA